MTPDPLRPRIFGIGLNKTATTSFHEAMEILGYRCLHWGGPPVRIAVETALEEGRPPLDDLDPTVEVFSDIEALSLNFAVLDRTYPGSRFVLTTRSRESWIDSRRRHVLRNRERRARGEYHGDFLDIDEPAWVELWDQHHRAVADYFRDRDDLLVVDFTRRARWDELCAFLDRPIPDVPFPWVNRGTEVEA